MGITNIQNQKRASSPATNTPWVNRGLAAEPRGPYQHKKFDKVGCGCNSGGNPFFSVDSYVPLNLQAYAQYLKTVKPQVMPRQTPARVRFPNWIMPTVRSYAY